MSCNCSPGWLYERQGERARPRSATTAKTSSRCRAKTNSSELAGCYAPATMVKIAVSPQGRTGMSVPTRKWKMMNLKKKLAVKSLVLFAYGCGDGDSDSAAGGGGQASSTTGAGTTTTSSSSSGSVTSTSSTGADLEAQCAARTPPDCGDPLETGCSSVAAYRFPAASGACTTPDLACDNAEVVQYCLFAPPATAFLQEPQHFQRTSGDMIEVIYLSAWPNPPYLGWETACEEPPACPGWERF